MIAYVPCATVRSQGPWVASLLLLATVTVSPPAWRVSGESSVDLRAPTACRAPACCIDTVGVSAELAHNGDETSIPPRAGDRGD